MAHLTAPMNTASLFDLTGKVALVTGATGRLGREMTFALAEMGADVVIVARTADKLEILRQEVETATQQRVMAITADVRHEQPIHDVFDQVMDTWGHLDILVNNVTGNAPGPVEQLEENAWDTAMHGIVGGMFLCAQTAGEIMKAQHYGNIINIASVYGLVAPDQRIYGDSGLNSSAVYGAGKAAVLQLTRYLAAYWATDGIRVNAITPGGVEDPSNAHLTFRQNYQNRTPMQRMMQRAEIRGPLVFLASQASSYVTGHNLVVDGGFSII